MPKPPPKPPLKPSWALQSHPVTPAEGEDLPPTAASPADAARYIAELTAELSVIARHAKLDLLAYILDMARLEATKARHAAGAGSEPP